MSSSSATRSRARTRSVVFAVASAALLALSSIQGVGAAFPGANGRIAFVRSAPLTSNIWTMNPDGSDEQPITTFAGPGDLCPDGLLGCDLPRSVRWSPDGGRLAFVWQESFGPFGQGTFTRLVTMNADGSNIVQVTCGPLDDPDPSSYACGGQDTGPSWAPDGSRLAYAHQVFGDPGSQIHITALGSRLFPGPALTALTGDSSFPAWSPDGRRIAFIHSDDPSSPYHVWVMNADGSNPVDLMPTETYGSGGAATFNRIDWSPDGSRIVYAGYNGDLWITRADGSARWQVTRTNGQFHRNPTWSPDGNRIAFECDPPLTTSEVYEVNADGTGQRRITFNNVDDQHPDWSWSATPLPAPPSSGVPDGCEAAPSGTTTTYTGDASVQYSDPASLSGLLQDSSGQTPAPIAGRQLDFTLGTQSGSAGPTDAAGTASTSLVVNQRPGSVTTVSTRFAGDDVFAASSDQDAFAILKEDCTLTYSGDVVVAPTALTNLAADVGELDTYLGDRSNKAVTFTVTSAAGQVQTFGATTNANGHAATSAPLPADVYAVNVAFAGDDYYKPCSTTGEVVVTAEAAQAKVTGGGWISIGTGRTSFGFNAIPNASGLWKGQIQIRATNAKSNFHGTTVLSLSASGNTATWTGTGYWLGQPNYNYTVSVVDNGSSSKKTDTISIVITDSRGAIVYTTSGPRVLKGGNIVVH